MSVDETLEQAVTLLLTGIGVDMNDPNIVDTPKRFVKALKSFSPHKEEPNVTVFDTQSTGVVVVKNLELRSLCQHHLFPFFGSCAVAYIPNGKIAGISKFQRVLDYVAEKPQDQENLTREMLHYLVDRIQPKAMLIVAKAKHSCMSVRGVKCHQGETLTAQCWGAEIGDSTYEILLKLIDS